MAVVLQLVLAGLALLAGCILFKRLKARSSFDLHHIPGPPGLPVVGNMFQVLGQKVLSWHTVTLTQLCSTLCTSVCELQ